MKINNVGLLKTIGKELRGIRKTNNIPLSEVAEKAGVSSMYISEIERDKKIPSDEIIIKLAKIYKMDEMDLYEGFGKITDKMLVEIIQNKDLYKVLYNIAEVSKPKLTNKEKTKLFKGLCEEYGKLVK